MNTEEIYTYILTVFEGKSFESIILKKSNTQYKNSFDSENRTKLVEFFNTDEYANIIQKLAKSFLINLTKGVAEKEITKEDCKNILEVYQNLLENISDYSKEYDEIANIHFNNVRSFIEDFTSKEKKNISNISYSPELIMEVLDINAEELTGYALDIGCGKEGEFVKFLNSTGIKAFGIDTECEDSEYLEQEDWLRKEYEQCKYDLITSHLSFTKYFLECNISELDGEEHIEYAKVYMKILNSLKTGGKWHYVPAVTFIEELLPEDDFKVENTFINKDIMRTVITKIK